MPNSTLPDPTVPPGDAGAVPADRYARLAELLRSAQGGRRESLNGIVVELSPVLWQVARAQGVDREAAEDVVQCTWLSLLRHLDEIRSPMALTAWLVTATKREAWRVRDAQRAEQRLDRTALFDEADAQPLPEERVLLAERHRDVWRAVRLLPRRCQELLRVVAFTHRPDYDEVATALGMPRGSVGPTRGRCLAKLRVLLDADASGGVA